MPDGEFAAGVLSSAPAEGEALALADVDPLFLVSAEDVDDDLAAEEAAEEEAEEDADEDADEDAEEETEEDAEEEAVDAATCVGDELAQVGLAVAPAPL